MSVTEEGVSYSEEIGHGEVLVILKCLLQGWETECSGVGEQTSRD